MYGASGEAGLAMVMDESSLYAVAVAGEQVIARARAAFDWFDYEALDE